MHRRIRRHARDALSVLGLALLSACSGCFLLHTTDEDRPSADAGISCSDASGRDSIDGWVRPFPEDCVEPSEISGPIEVCIPSEVGLGEMVDLELTAQCASCQQFTAACHVGTTGRETSITIGMVTCPVSLACRECVDECHAETQLCPFMGEEPGTYTVSIDGREGAFELRVGRATSDAMTCVTL